MTSFLGEAGDPLWILKGCLVYAHAEEGSSLEVLICYHVQSAFPTTLWKLIDAACMQP